MDLEIKKEGSGRNHRGDTLRVRERSNSVNRSTGPIRDGGTSFGRRVSSTFVVASAYGQSYKVRFCAVQNSTPHTQIDWVLT